ncbi:BED zinc finger,hAT family dimerization domain isoform 1 [Dorcoceras hygrometricum]|uniref:BED zinc finger,hAT family dimerization domain isoform 1 n=1 Tax=Dorcoceras hygrometricum TaxID=472368 RepID=A0A2Z7CFW6_9LAMI|nr:BED zinc finger,hAT family dimerization domain isoform 1 [Dorcoceras hygrometricum]
MTFDPLIWSWTGLAYLPQSTEKSRVLETPVGARHKCQRANARLLVLLHDPTSSLPHLPKVVSIERATLKECNATGLAQNRDGKRRESTDKSYGEQCLGFETENDR